MLIPFDCPETFDPDEFPVLRFSPEGSRLLVSAKDQDWADVLDVEAGKQLRQFSGLGDLSDAVFLDEDRLLLVHGGHGSLHHARTGRQMKWAGRELPARTAWLSHDRALLGLAGGGLRVFDLRAKRCVRVLVWVHSGNITVGAFSPDGRYVAADSYADRHSDAAGRFVQVWDLRSKWRYHHCVFEPRRRGQGDAGGIAFTPDNRLLAFSADSGVELLSMEEGESVAQYDPGPSITQSLRVSPSGCSLEVMSFDGQLARVEVESGRVLQRLAAPAGYEVRACTVSPRNVAAGVAGKGVLLWPLPEWKED